MTAPANPALDLVVEALNNQRSLGYGDGMIGRRPAYHVIEAAARALLAALAQTNDAGLAERLKAKGFKPPPKWDVTPYPNVRRVDDTNDAGRGEPIGTVHAIRDAFGPTAAVQWHSGKPPAHGTLLYLAPPPGAAVRDDVRSEWGVSPNMLTRWAHLQAGTATWSITAAHIHEQLRNARALSTQRGEQ